MDAIQERNSEAQARRDVAAHPERSHGHEEAMRRYLGAALYEETRPELDVPLPVDEPVPPARRVRRRR